MPGIDEQRVVPAEMVHVDGICDPRHEPPFVCLWLFDRLCLSVTVFVFAQLCACARHHKCRAEAKHWPVWPKRTTPTVINTSEIAAAGDRHGRSCGRKLICCRLNARIFVDRMVMLRLGHVCYFREQLSRTLPGAGQSIDFRKPAYSVQQNYQYSTMALRRVRK